MQFTQALHRAAQEKPSAIATVSDARLRTFSQMIDRVARLAGAMHQMGNVLDAAALTSQHLDLRDPHSAKHGPPEKGPRLREVGQLRVAAQGPS